MHENTVPGKIVPVSYTNVWTELEFTVNFNFEMNLFEINLIL
jgi:hypothetical protein